ncbi:phenylalanine--tRNA ligase subunit beta [Candidatus Kuenenbacteria bacterium HGW-Kuenenbacteria-1]|uniref:Phenylalanine--tRNA ligase beta subunit n=1 Tax=Candidatus Kuenenbacteria bacterium HGW-Kuenenbacteria-1 TaxID=2013812 RepID=A0A2N1UNU2_9BACT|nr:MAG: phenylalanine--tRNA ligase subunit beta [Candidatus Kuenenbacteria bacterium HGW-Kuenenbacteria-1]
MYLSLNWLKEFVDIPKSITPEELGLKLTTHTVEIDGIKKQAENLDGVVVGEILEIKKHPNADKLQLVKVAIGKEKLEIVCGASNIEVGQLVPVALIGAILPNGMEIKEAEIRGEKSNGMLCAEDELGLGKGHDGILILNKTEVGQKFNEYLGLDDVVFEVDNKSITNRPDLWGHYGMAREIGAFLNIKLKKYNVNTVNKNVNSANMRIKVKVEDQKLCPRYMAIAMDGIKIKQSPEWMQKRLIAVGMRPINNIVDITNYVMLELGQPTHIFDFDKIKSVISKQIPSASWRTKSKINIIIRNAKNNETIKTLDNKDQKLDESMLVIADNKKSIAIAGVMGGANSEVDENTTSILIESANFDPVSIRKTSQKLGLRSEASMRFEKSLDPNLCEIAMARIMELIKEFCPQAEIISELSDEKKYSLNQGPIELDLEWVEKRIGKKIEEKKIIEILENLGFEIRKNNNILIITIPTWRATKDISISEDLIEEIIRIYGYDNLESEMPIIMMEAPEINNKRLLERKIKNILSIGAKLTEVYNYSFIGEEQLKKIKINNFSSFIKLANPIASNQTMLQQSLVFNLLENIKLNQAKYENIGLFEIGNIFLNSSGNINKDNKTKDILPYQEKNIGIILASKNDNLFNKAKGVVEYLVNDFNLEINFNPIKDCPEWANKKTVAEIIIANKNIGIVAQLDEKIASNVGIKKQVVVVEINFQKFCDLILNNQNKKYQEIPQHPPVIRDLAFVIDEEILYSDIKNEIENFNYLISLVELFDVFQGGRLGHGKKSLAFHIIYQAIDRTLTIEEIDQMQEKLIKTLEKKFNAQIRDF